MRESLWFVPTLMVFASIVVAVVLIEANDVLWNEGFESFPRMFGAGADGSRGMLTAIAGSMITVATLAFSLTIVAMSQVASQYSSRVLRNFMRDRRNQFVLGYFVSVFAYCLVVLRTIRGGDEGGFIPSIAVFVGLLLAIASIAVLIFFIHHIATSLQASVIIANTADDTKAAVRRLFPVPSSDEPEADLDEGLEEPNEWHRISAEHTGFIQAADQEDLLAFAGTQGCVIRMERAIGDFISKGSPIVSVSRSLPEEDFENVRRAFSIGRFRTLEQDAAFGIRQLVDIALRALSPGVNDTTTAAVCVDHLGSVLCELAERKAGRKFQKDDAGVIRVIAKEATFTSFVDQAFDQIRDSASDNPAIFLRQLEALRDIAQRTRNTQRLSALREKAALIEEAAQRTSSSEYNRINVVREAGQLSVFLTSLITAARVGRRSGTLDKPAGLGG